MTGNKPCFEFEESGYADIAERMLAVAGNAIVAVSSVDPDKQLLTSRAIVGIGSDMHIVNRMVGRSTIGWHSRIPEDALQHLQAGELRVIDDGLHSVFLRSFPHAMTRLVQKLLGITEVYGRGVLLDGRPVLSIVLAMREDLPERARGRLEELFADVAAMLTPGADDASLRPDG